MIEHSEYYKTFANVLTVRTVTAEYMVAMKLMAGRRYKNDMSDVIGVLKHHKDNGSPITIDRIKNAVEELYGDWRALPDRSISFIEEIMAEEDYDNAFDKIRRLEVANRSIIETFEEDYPGVLTDENLDDILQRFSETISAEEEQDEDSSESPVQSM